MPEFLHGELTRKIIGAGFEVWKVLGYGFLENVYENSLAEEFKRNGIAFQQQFAIDVKYKGVLVGAFVADLFVDGKVIVEIKTEKEYNPKHEAQLLNYLKATGIRVGLILNFGEKRCEHKRLII